MSQSLPELSCPKCESKMVFSWCGQLNKVHFTRVSDGYGGTKVLTSHHREAIGASMNCGGCGFTLQGQPTETLRQVTPRWRAMMVST